MDSVIRIILEGSENVHESQIHLTPWTVCLDLPCSCPPFVFFLYILPSRGCDCSRAEGQQFWHLQPSEGISNAICDPPGSWINNPPCLRLESQTTKPHLGLIWSSESLTLVHTLIPKVQHIPTYCCTKRVNRHGHPERMDYGLWIMIQFFSFTINHYMDTDKVAKQIYIIDMARRLLSWFLEPVLWQSFCWELWGKV